MSRIYRQVDTGTKKTDPASSGRDCAPLPEIPHRALTNTETSSRPANAVSRSSVGQSRLYAMLLLEQGLFTLAAILSGTVPAREHEHIPSGVYIIWRNTLFINVFCAMLLCPMFVIVVKVCTSRQFVSAKIKNPLATPPERLSRPLRGTAQKPFTLFFEGQQEGIPIGKSIIPADHVNVNRFVVKKPHSSTDTPAMHVQTTNGVEARGREPATGHSIEGAQAGKSKVHTK